jgi:hypothetical protein
MFSLAFQHHQYQHIEDLLHRHFVRRYQYRYTDDTSTSSITLHIDYTSANSNHMYIHRIIAGMQEIHTHAIQWKVRDACISMRARISKAVEQIEMRIICRIESKAHVCYLTQQGERMLDICCAHRVKLCNLQGMETARSLAS